MKTIPIFLFLIPALLIAGKKDSTAAKYGETLLSIDSLATKQAAMPVYRDSKGENYIAVKLLPDGTLGLSNGARFSRITARELTAEYLEAILAESEAMASELLAARLRVKARKDNQ